jgi:hypothetical protein
MGVPPSFLGSEVGAYRFPARVKARKGEAQRHARRHRPSGARLESPPIRVFRSAGNSRSSDHRHPPLNRENRTSHEEPVPKVEYFLFNVFFPHFGQGVWGISSSVHHFSTMVSHDAQRIS